jgi:hypothetical protein
MSTKATIAYGDEFHFYREVLDDDHVYLEMHGTHFEAGYNRVMIPISIHIWETIRHLGGADLDHVDKTDEELLSMIETDVNERRAQYQAAAREGQPDATILKISGALQYGSADDPRQEQIARGVEYFTAQRQHQREIRTAIEALRAKQRRR